MTRPDWLALAPEVAEALRHSEPVVAFESTVIAHGLPRPRNLELARRTEVIAREEGCVPATVAILGGRLHVGLAEEEITQLTTPGVAKVNLSNLPAVLATGLTGATTVAATMLACDLAGIEVFATGGIGGVHPNAAEDFDISADLTALSRFRVSVVSAGAKAILDLSATLQALETRGVPVIGFGIDEFPAFYSRTSGFAVDARVDTPAEAAQVIAAHRANPHAGGLLLANPIPPEHALEADEIADAIARAQTDAAAQGIRGREVTPFLLGAIERHTGSRSLEANIALLESNARLAAQVAKALARR